MLLPALRNISRYYASKCLDWYPALITWYLKVGKNYFLQKDNKSPFDLGFKKIGNFYMIAWIFGSISDRQVVSDQ